MRMTPKKPLRQRSAIASQLACQWTALQCIPRAPSWVSTTEVLRFLQDKGIDLPARTVQRYLAALAEVLPIVATPGAGNSKRWAWKGKQPGLVVPAPPVPSKKARRLVDPLFYAVTWPDGRVTVIANHNKKELVFTRGSKDKIPSEILAETEWV